MTVHFFDKLCAKIRETKSVAVVGLDPRIDYVPFFMKEGKHPADAIWEYNKKIIDTIAGKVPGVKVQIAFYENMGIKGMETYSKTLKYANEKGLLTIGDIKRGDIGSTAEGYAQAHLGQGQDFEADAVTLNPYLGSDSIKPFLKLAQENGKGLFILVKTSNPSSAELQDIESEGTKIYELMGDMISQLGSEIIGEEGFSPNGMVIGGTFPEVGERLRKKYNSNFFLIPGYGAQGATASDLKMFFKANTFGAVVNSSRGIIAAHMKTDTPEEKWLDDVAEAVESMNSDFSYLF